MAAPGSGSLFTDNEPSDVASLRCAIVQQPRDAVTLGHEQRTATLARELAQIHGVDPDRVELAALVHDIAAHRPPESLLSLARQFSIPISNAELMRPALLHGPVGAELLRREYGVGDYDLLEAVRNHVVGGSRMSLLAKILFVADKLEPGRRRLMHDLDPLRAEARTNLDRTLLHLYAVQIADLVARSIPVDERTVTAYNLLIKELRFRDGARL
jgi:predicted HD superfamily hydrolase involved in NAD metabolism